MAKKFAQLIAENPNSTPFMRRFAEFRRKDRIVPIMERLFSELDAFRQSSAATNPFIARVLGSFEDIGRVFDQAGAGIAQALQGAQDLPSLIRRQAAASTLPSQIAALQAARQAASRGGLAFGGGGAGIAARAGATSAALTSGAELGALAQAPLAQARVAQAAGALGAQRGGTISQLAGLGGQLFEAQSQRQLRPQEVLIEALMNLGSLFESGATARAQTRLSRPSLMSQIAGLLQGAGSFLGSIPGSNTKRTG